MALMGIAIVAGAGTVWRHSPTVALPDWSLRVSALALIPLGQWLAGLIPFAGDALLNVLFLMGLCAAIAIGARTFPTSPRENAGAPWISLGMLLWLPALLSALIGGLQWLSLSEILGVFASHVEVGTQPNGNVAQSNQFGTLLLMGICGAWHDYERRRLGRLAFAALLGLMTAVLLLTQSRTGLLSATVLAAFLYWKLRAPAAGRWRTPGWAPLAWCGWLWAGNTAVPWLNQALLLGQGRQIALLDPNNRQLVWGQMIHAIKESPWWGYGWNQTPTAQNVGALGMPGDLTYDYAHNLVLDLVVWCGLPLGLLVTAVAGYWFVTRLLKVNSLLGVAAAGALIPITVHSLLEYPFAYGYFLVTGGLLIGAIEAESSGPWRTLRIRPKAIRLVAALTAGLGLYVAYEYVRVEEDFRVVRFQGMRVGQVPEGYQMPRFYLLTQFKAMLTAGRMKAQAGMRPEDLDLLEKAARRFPYGALSYRYALALAFNDRPRDAEQQFKVIRSMYGARYYAGVAEDFKMKQGIYPELTTTHLP